MLLLGEGEKCSRVDNPTHCCPEGPAATKDEQIRGRLGSLVDRGRGGGV